MTPHIKVWKFGDAPQMLRDLSEHCGDEDWLALVPAGWPVPSWLEDNRAFGPCDISEHATSTGTVLIGAHS